MITIALLALVLQNSADDCAVLEAIVATQWQENQIMGADFSSGIPEQQFVAFRPFRSAFPFWCSHADGLENPAEIDACERRAIDHFEALSPAERLAEGFRAGEGLAVWASGTSLDAWSNAAGEVEIPEGLEASFTDAVNLHQNWGCRSANWQYIDADYYGGIADELLGGAIERPGYYLQITRPGYSSDGYWAVTAYFDAYIFEEPIPWSGGAPLRLASSNGYHIYARQSGEWREIDRVVRGFTLIQTPQPAPERILE